MVNEETSLPASSVAARLVGSWTLLSYTTEAPDGTTGKPYGDAVGRLNYDALGNMAGQVMRPNRLAVASFRPRAYLATSIRAPGGDRSGDRRGGITIRPFRPNYGPGHSPLPTRPATR